MSNWYWLAIIIALVAVIAVIELRDWKKPSDEDEDGEHETGAWAKPDPEDDARHRGF